MGNHRVLIVEDALELGRLIRSALDTLKAPLEVAVVPSAEEALLVASRRGVDLLITDERLPGIPGLELIRRLKERKKVGKVMVITALKAPGLEKQARDAGADAFFFKPLAMTEFLRTVGRLLELELPPELREMAEPSQQAAAAPMDLSGLLADLRASLSAIAVCLLDAEGRVAAAAGELPAPLIPGRVIPALLPAVSAAEKVSDVLDGSGRESLLAFRGSTYEMLAMPLGHGYAALAVMAAVARPARLIMAGEELLHAHSSLVGALSGMGVQLAREAVPSGGEDAVAPPEAALRPASQRDLGAGDEAELSDLQRLLEEGASWKPAADEVDAYWELADGAVEPPVSPDMLTYDQARQLGLAPEDKDSDA